MALVSLEGRWIHVKTALCKLLGRTEPDLLATNFQSITHPDDLHTDLSFVRRLVDGDISDYQIVKRYLHKAGHLVWVLLSVSLVHDDQQKPLYFIAQIQDITRHTRRRMAPAAAKKNSRHVRTLRHRKMQIDLAAARFLSREPQIL